VNSCPRLHLVEQPDGGAQIFLDGQFAGSLYARWADDLRHTDVEFVERLLAQKGFDYEFDEEGERAARRYGRILWQAIVHSMAEAPSRRSVWSAQAVEVVVEGSSIHQLAWELINGGTLDRPRWLCLGRTVVRINASVVALEPVSGTASQAVLLLTARPYADDDIPFDLLPHTVARSLSRSGRSVLQWLPGASRQRLEQLSLPSRPWIIHIDAHAVTHARAEHALIDHPHILLESGTGPDPCDISEILYLLKGQVPDLLIVTSCGTDVRAVAAELTVQGQAARLGAKGILVSRRRLTPAEVTVFSGAFYRTIAKGLPITTAVAQARAALRRQARRDAQVGRLAWASFTYYVSSEDARADLDCEVSVATAPEADIARPPPWIPAVRRQPDYVLVQRTPDEAAAELGAVAYWASILLPQLRLEGGNIPTGGALAVPLTVADLTEGTSPRAILEAGLPTLPPAAGGTILVFVQCPPREMADAHSHFSFEILGPSRGWVADDSCSGTLRNRWWQFPGGHGLTAPPRRITVDGTAADDDEFDEIVDLLASEVVRAGHSRSRLTRFLLSYSTGYWRRRGFRPRHFTKSFLAGEAFVRAACRAGLTRRACAGVYVLDVYHPRLIGAIQRHVRRSATRWLPPVGEPWLDWLQRLGEYPEFDQSVNLPSFFTAAERFTAPEQAIGDQLPAVCVRNHIFRAAILYQGGRPSNYWWTGYDGLLTPVDRDTRDAIATSMMPIPPTFLRAGSGHDAVGSNRLRIPMILGSSYYELGRLISVLGDRTVIYDSLLSETVNGWAARKLGQVVMPQDGQVARQALERVLAWTVWPEDRGIILAVAGTAVSPFNPELALELYGEAFEAFLSVRTPMCRAFALDVLHWKTVVLRQQKRHPDCKQVIGLGVKLMKKWDFGRWHSSCAEFLEEIAQVDPVAQLEISGTLMPQARHWPVNERYHLVQDRIVALMHVNRFAEAGSIVRREVASGEYGPDQVRVLMVFQAECCQKRGENRQALRLCQEIMQTAEGEVFAHAALIQGQAQLSQECADEALSSFQAGWRAAGATSWGSQCAWGASLLLNAFDRYEECLAFVGEARRSALFPMSSLTCLNGAIAAANLGKHDIMRELLLVGIWAQIDTDFYRTAHRLGFKDDLQAALGQVAQAAHRWITTGDDAARPSEVRMRREEYAEYWSTRVVERCLEVAQMTAETAALLRKEGLLDQFWIEVVGELWAVHGLATELVDGNPRLALAINRTICDHLDKSAALHRPEVKLVYAQSAFYIGSINRELGDLDAAIAWGEIAAQASRSVISHEDEAIRNCGRDMASRALELIGNSCYDQLRFGTAVTFHTQGLLTALGLDSEDTSTILPDVLRQFVAAPPTSHRILSLLFNLGNSLSSLRGELYARARIALLLGAANLPDLERYASTKHGHFMLSELTRDLKGNFDTQNFPEQWKVAWQRVQAACAAELIAKPTNSDSKHRQPI
jgi:hypothetical protein